MEATRSRADAAADDARGGGADAWQEAQGGQAEPSLKDLILSLIEDIPGALSDRVHLVALELGCVRHALVRVLVSTVAIGIFAATAWTALWAFCFVFATARGASGELVLALVFLLNAVGAWFAFGSLKRWSLRLGLPATVRSLTVPESRAAAARTPGEGRGD